ncbi:serine/threonine-protein kinase Nek4 isoform X2 [Poeciliopsis prolifica]|uniref:serine/threonine-protein kinase Nek4 isoform X2 n=1 Tax=Poeciliopsis prolifica TaxID=188132 RepID=UPI002412FD8A|nr:serine/threonine-protein kinase Nek4 isoform X2 [Poeciliopsis prolifica]
MNSYSFIRVVGKGSYGEVNLVKHKTDRKQYVIKKLNLTTSSKRERRAAEQEAQLLSQLRHPNIVTYRESWEGDDRQLYIVMGFCEGGDLYHRLKQQKGEHLPERQVVEWFVQIAMALQYLHERNILHRDLKTQNIFLTKTNIIKVGDLGIARVLENQNDMASTLIGTPYYMSPELFSNKPYNHKSDVWALGCCVYEMSTLKHAFNAKDMNSLVYRIVEGKLPPMPSQYHPHLGELIKSMLCKKPEDRPDVKHILRQPYIKRQIAMFLEATKEKTAKSRKKAAVGPGDCCPSGGSSGVSYHPKPQELPPSPNADTVAQAKQREDKADHKTQNGVADFPPALPSQAISSSADIFKAGISPLATVSSITIDIPLQPSDGVMKNWVQRPPSVESQREPGTRIACKDRKARRKPDPSPLPSPVNPALRAESGVCARGGDKRTASNGLLDMQPNPGGTRPVSVEKRDSVVDIKEDTGELLREAELISNANNVTASNNDTVTLIKGTPINLHMPNVDDSLETTEKLLEPPAVEPVEAESSSLSINQDPATVCQNPQVLPEPSGSEQHRGMLFDPTNGGHKQLAASRPLPRPPLEAAAVERKRRIKKSMESKRVDVTAASTSVSSSGDGLLPLPQERPLTARERRRLRQSQDGAGLPGPSAVRRASYDVASTKVERHNAPVTRSASYSIADSSTKDRLMEQRSDEDEYSSSTSSTERSGGDCRERKTESNDMHDLVHMMTQTLRMDVGDAGRELGKGQLDSTAMPEFKLNRRYRDTLVLHGKAREEAGNLSLGEIPTGATSGPAKVRRAIERLRTDVVKGLGVKLLDKVLEIMEEEDEVKRELCLRDQMGDEKYQAYAVMVRQLKFFEDIAVKI